MQQFCCCIFIYLSLFLELFNNITAQNFYKIHSTAEEAPVDKRIKITWCTTSREEERKCENFAMANERDRIRVGYDYFNLQCKQVSYQKLIQKSNSH